MSFIFSWGWIILPNRRYKCIEGLISKMTVSFHQNDRHNERLFWFLEKGHFGTFAVTRVVDRVHWTAHFGPSTLGKNIWTVHFRLVASILMVYP